MKHLLAIAITLLPTAALAEQFTPEQMLDVMTKSPSNRDLRIQDGLQDLHALPLSSNATGITRGAPGAKSGLN